MPPVSDCVPEVLAVISRCVAIGAEIARIFVPRSTQLSPSRRAVVDTSTRWSPEVGSVEARATTAVPSAICSSTLVAEPARCSRPPATTTVSIYGSTTSA
ncbi:hypothetical protein BH09ACT8_BH09ACT8_39900 [soil metagenome]